MENEKKWKAFDIRDIRHAMSMKINQIKGEIKKENNETIQTIRLFEYFSSLYEAQPSSTIDFAEF